MQQAESGTPQKIGEINRKLILDYVRKHGPISRAQLHRCLNMSAPSVSANVKIMLESGHLLEAGEGDNLRGRKSTLLRFNAKRACVIGVDVGRSQIRVILADLDGNEVAGLQEDNAAAEGGADGLRGRLLDIMARVVAQGNVDPGLVCWICVGLPGVPDLARGVLNAAPFIHVPDLRELHRSLQDAWPNARIQFENSVNYGAVGEKWKGVAGDYRNVIYFDYGVGIGAALILNGELFRGTHGAAGEVGYMVPEVAHFREVFETQGVLETLISGKRVGDILKARQGGATEFRDLTVEEALNDRAMRRIADYMGAVLVNITAVFNEELIILGGRFGAFLGELFIPTWQKLLAQHVPYVPEIKISALASRADVMGAVAVAIRQANDEVILAREEAE